MSVSTFNKNVVYILTLSKKVSVTDEQLQNNFILKDIFTWQFLTKNGIANYFQKLLVYLRLKMGMIFPATGRIVNKCIP